MRVEDNDKSEVPRRRRRRRLKRDRVRVRERKEASSTTPKETQKLDNKENEAPPKEIAKKDALSSALSKISGQTNTSNEALVKESKTSGKNLEALKQPPHKKKTRVKRQSLIEKRTERREQRLSCTINFKSRERRK